MQPPGALHITPANDVEGDVDRALRAGPGASLKGARLAGAGLRGAQLAHVDLSGADLSDADLSGANLMGSNLRGTLLHRANLEGAELLGADLEGANLSEARAAGAGFGRARLVAANCFEVDMRGATLTEAVLSESDFRAADLRSARLRDAVMGNTNFHRAKLQEADLEGASVPGSSFIEADLRKARLRSLKRFADTQFFHADIRDIDFSGAYLLRRQILDENYLLEFRSQGKLAALVFWVWWVTSDCGRSIGRWALWTIAVWLVFGVAFQWCDLDYGDHQTPISSYYFSLVTLTTLSYGDVLPRSMAAQVVVMFEVVIGYLMLGGLLTIISAKMGRRAD